MAGAVEHSFLFSPWDGAAQVCATMPEGQKPAILQPREVKSPLLDVAHSARFKFVYPPGVDSGAEGSLFDPWFEKIE
jgi:hypothetical protein